MPKFSISTSIFRIISLVTVLTIFVGATVFEVSNAYAEVQFGEETPASAEIPTTVSPTVTSEATSTYTPVPPIQDTITTTASPTVTSEATATHTPVPSLAPDYCSMSQSQFDYRGEDVINHFLADCGDNGETKNLCRAVATQVKKDLKKISRATLTNATTKIFADPAPAKPPVYRPISPREGMEIIQKACMLRNESGFPCRLSDYNVRTWCCQHQSYTAVTAAQANGLVACQIQVPNHVLAAIEVSINGKTETLVFESMTLTPIGYLRRGQQGFYIDFLPGYRGTKYRLDANPICKRPNAEPGNNGFRPPFPNPGPNDKGAKHPFEIYCLNAVKQVTEK